LRTRSLVIYTDLLITELGLMNKFEKIQVVKILGVNTENSVLITDMSDYWREYGKMQMWGDVSIRTMKAGSGDRSFYGKTPHYPVVKEKTVEKKCRQLIKDGYWAIVAECIDPKNAELAGAIHVGPELTTVELAKGPGTTRRVTHDGKIDIKFQVPTHMIYRFVSLHEDDRVNDMLAALRPIQSDSYVAEVSYYSEPVGWNCQHVIVWELTDDGTGSSIFAPGKRVTGIRSPKIPPPPKGRVSR